MNRTKSAAQEDAQRLLEAWVQQETPVVVTINGTIAMSISGYLLSVAHGLVLCSAGEPGPRPLLTFSLKPANYTRVKVDGKALPRVLFYDGRDVAVSVSQITNQES